MEFAEASYEGEPCQQINFRQQTMSAELAKELDVLRSKDLVTDLYNRQYCLGELERMVGEAAKGRNDQALLLIEADNFKSLLDTVGLGNADLLLGDMANLMRRHLKDADVAGRFGEHAFGVLVVGRNAEEVRQLGETLRHAFEDRIFEVGKQSVNANISIGGTLIGEKNANAQAVLAQASTALRTAQTEGGNRVNVFDPGAKDKADEEKNKHWLSLVKDALANNGFVLFYQPIISLHGAEGEFYEILLRMNGPKGEIGPAFFMPIAEQNGLLSHIDRWVIGAAIKALAERERATRRRSSSNSRRNRWTTRPCCRGSRSS
jgi:diguanylate cyclase (GGDEF)-like protein